MRALDLVRLLPSGQPSRLFLRIGQAALPSHLLLDGTALIECVSLHFLLKID